VGQQQLLIVLLGVVIVSIAIAAGMGLFGANKVKANKDAIINDMNTIAVSALRYRSKPKVLLGGGGSYRGFVLSDKYKPNPNATYACVANDSEITILAISAVDSTNTITGMAGTDGKLIKSEFVFTGDFQ
jgi:hypothetical protein